MKLGGRGFFWAVAAIVATLLAFYAYGGYLVSKYGGLERDFGWRAAAREGSWTVTRVDPTGPAAAALEPGDEILAIDGDRRVAKFGPWYKLRVEPPDRRYSVTFLRGGEPIEQSIEVIVTRDRRRLLVLLPVLLASLSFFVISTVVGFLRPADRMPRLLVLAGFPCAAVLMMVFLSPLMRFLQGWEHAFPLLIGLIPPFHLLLACRFYYWFTSPVPVDDRPVAKLDRSPVGTAETMPAPGFSQLDTMEDPVAREDRRARPPFPHGRLWAFVYYGLWVWSLLLYFPFQVFGFLRIANVPIAMDFVAANYSWLGPWWQFEGYSGGLLGGAALAAMFGVAVTSYRRLEQPDQKRRVRWVVWGTAVGLLPPLVVWVSGPVFRMLGLEAWAASAAWRYAYQISTGLPILVPITLGHAVARHQVLGVEVVVRRGVRYLLAKNVLRLILLLPVAGLVYTVVANPDRTIGELLFERASAFYLFLITTGGLSLRYRTHLSSWIDRRFFREKYNQEQILLSLIERVKSCDSVPEISELVCAEIGLALHPERSYVFFRDPERPGLALSYSSAGEGHALRIEERSPLVALMEGRAKPLDLGTGPPGRQRLPSSEREWLTGLGVQLVVPMLRSDLRLAGLLLLGRKRSEEPYAPEDVRLLVAIAGQVAVICENIWLRERADRDSRERRDVLAHLDRERVNLVKECPLCGACFDQADSVCAEDGAELRLALPVERNLEGRYRLERVLGKGGMGAVYQATDGRLQRQVAVKILMGHLFGQQAALRRFEREARASANLKHPNIIAVFDYGRTGADGAFLVMELVEGKTFRALLRERGKIEPAVLAEWFDQTLAGLDEAHSNGVIHRDLKPENLMIGTDAVKILDFGLAKTRMMGIGESMSLTVPGTVLGTISYMSPEQLTGKKVDERADLFSLAVIVFEGLTGERPFAGDSAAEILSSIHNDTPVLGGAGDTVRQVEDLLRTGLARDARDRFSSAREMREALIPALSQWGAR